MGQQRTEQELRQLVDIAEVTGNNKDYQQFAYELSVLKTKGPKK